MEERLKELVGNVKFNNNQLLQIRVGLKNNLSTQKIELYAKPSLSDWMMYKIRKFLESGISFKTAKKCINYDLCHNQLIQVLTGFENGLEWDQVKMYASYEIPYWIMKDIRKRLEKEWN